MTIVTKTTNTDAPTGGKTNDLQALRRRHTAIEKECSALAEATADKRAAVQRLKAAHADAQATARAAQRDYSAALARRAVPKSSADAPPAPGQSLAHAHGLAAAIEIAEGMVAEAAAAEEPALARLADARDALDHAEFQAARAEFEAGLYALMPALAHLRSATLRRQAPWRMPDLGECWRAWEYAQGTAEPLGERRWFNQLV
ncbi:hypothetical protein AcdelDRAFT_3312 [Acidovorax delafieldii 2AN]|uniref:Uncharacterized protein n=1 Tax=Acidovorax delafieldii 2AN TaxID=573060 RepID=C5T8T2_ACIDE|nr:hypothetical protein [Acidovorax delafieldii]EER59111.1 hypothetical protein AcdelDRAFT_3312 [Acidovorax delafieldii 2AN]